MRMRNKRRRCSSTEIPDATRATTANGRSRETVAVAVKALEDQPPHLRYHPETKSRLTIHPINKVTPIQLIRRRTGCGGRSGRTNRRTSGIARSVKGTLSQKIQRQESVSLTQAVKSGVVGRVA